MSRFCSLWIDDADVTFLTVNPNLRAGWMYGKLFHGCACLILAPQAAIQTMANILMTKTTHVIQAIFRTSLWKRCGSGFQLPTMPSRPSQLTPVRMVAMKKGSGILMGMGGLEILLGGGTPLLTESLFHNYLCPIEHDEMS
jgi:hypothetical protein